MVSSLPYCMQGANTAACIHETCKGRTPMHAYVRAPMHAYMKHAMCEHRCMQTWTVQLRYEHRAAMSVSQSIDGSRLIIFELRERTHQRTIEDDTATVLFVCLICLFVCLVFLLRTDCMRDGVQMSSLERTQMCSLERTPTHVFCAGKQP